MGGGSLKANSGVAARSARIWRQSAGGIGGAALSVEPGRGASERSTQENLPRPAAPITGWANTESSVSTEFRVGVYDHDSCGSVSSDRNCPFATSDDRFAQPKLNEHVYR
jgi:hypothetical protein